MGLNVSIQTIDGQYHPNWDDGKYHGDREISAAVASAKPVIHWLDECNFVERPTEFAAFRAFAWPDYNQERWTRLADILENEPQFWIYYSV
tara:strand:+ start:561 stop:833 length:273 start_codon:yes stop_codon:yes gene_type:complete